MPHDAKGDQIYAGDMVNVRCRVKEVYQTDEFCNVIVETVLPMFPNNNATTITLNSSQVWKLFNEG